MPPQPSSITAEQLLALRDHNWLELHAGKPRRVAPLTTRHVNIAAEISNQLHQFARPRKLGSVFVRGGFILRRQPDTVCKPDVSFIRQSRISADGLPSGYLAGPPDLAVELVSPATPHHDLLEKIKTYLAHGTTLCWLVDPLAQTIDIHHLARAVETRHAEEKISADDLIPGFAVAVSEFFA